MTPISDDQLNHLRHIVDLPDLNSDRYDVIKRVASGGMATVYLAEDRRLHRRVALKVLSQIDESGDTAARMAQEAKVIAKLEHPAIVPIHDVGRLRDGRLFHVMKYVEGVTLDVHCQGQPMLSEKLRVFQKICEGISFAHAAGVIHRDLKPSNVMIGAFGEVLVMDWGIAKLLSPSSDTETVRTRSTPLSGDASEDDLCIHTQKGAIIGTPVYMSPEQVNGDTENIDERSDIYALGGLLYYMITSQPPFKSTSFAEVARSISGHGPLPPRRVKPKTPKRLEAICLKAMAVEKQKRYASAVELSADISRFLAREPVTAYRETAPDKFWRWAVRYSLILIIVIAYFVTRIILFFWFGR